MQFSSQCLPEPGPHISFEFEVNCLLMKIYDLSNGLYFKTEREKEEEKERVGLTL